MDLKSQTEKVQNNVCKEKNCNGHIIMSIQNSKDKDSNSLWRGKKGHV